MMAILELALWIIATPFLLLIGFALLGAILGLISDPLSGTPEESRTREKRIKRGER